MRNSITAAEFRKRVGIAPPPVTPVCDFTPAPSTDEAKLNKTERAFLETLRFRRVEGIQVQAVTLKLGNDCRYTADFSGIENGRFTLYEVKGFMRDDAAVKLRVAARQFRQFRFVLVRRVAGKWEETEVKA